MSAGWLGTNTAIVETTISCTPAIAHPLPPLLLSVPRNLRLPSPAARRRCTLRRTPSSPLTHTTQTHIHIHTIPISTIHQHATSRISPPLAEIQLGIGGEVAGGEATHEVLDVGALGGLELVGFALLGLDAAAFDPCAEAVFEGLADHIAACCDDGGRDDHDGCADVAVGEVVMVVVVGIGGRGIGM